MSPPIFCNYFPHYNIAFGSKCLLLGLEYPTSCIRNLLPFTCILPNIHRIEVLAKDKYILLCLCLAMLSEMLSRPVDMLLLELWWNDRMMVENGGDI